MNLKFKISKISHFCLLKKKERANNKVGSAKNSDKQSKVDSMIVLF